MIMKKLFIALGLALLVVGCRSMVGPKESGTTFAKDALQKYVDSGEIPGIVCVFYENGIQETACLGYADARTKRPITIDDPFMQCSQTKGFCGVCIAMLIEEGKISLDDPVSKYLPEFDELWVQESNQDGVKRIVRAKNTLTIRMCMNHTGGFGFDLPNYEKMGGWNHRMPLRSVAAIAAALPLQFEPGTEAQYSNVGIDIGAAIVEVVTGKRWEDFLKERIFSPLGMDSATFWPSEKQQASKIELYEIKLGEQAKWVESHPAMQRPYGDSRVFPSAGAGLWITVRDQLKFYKMLMNLGIGENGVRILQEDTVKKLLAVSSRPKDMGGYYSLGLSAPEVDGEDQWFGHGGAFYTDGSINWHRRQLKLVAVQYLGDAGEVINAYKQAADAFFKSQTDKDGVSSAYIGRME